MVSNFYSLFPKINYNISQQKPAVTEEATNIFIRVGILKNILNNISAYTVYDIEDGDTPEIVAQKAYNDAGAAWMILLANQIMDPQFDWPLDYKSFEQYIIDKYGSVETAKITPHHYEKVITRRNTRTNVTNVTRFWVNENRLTDNMPADVDFSYFKTYITEDPNATLDEGNLALTGYFASPQYYVVNGEEIEVIIKGVEVMCYDYEVELNDDKKSIKVIKREYYSRVLQEFNELVGVSPTYIRRLV